MSRSCSFRRALGALAATSLLVGLVPTVATAATPEKRDITTFACPSGEVPDPGFSDDDETTAEHRAGIACVVWYEIASGETTTTYAPHEAVNRGQMASFIGNLLVRADVALSENPPNAFPDDDGTRHEKRINQLADLGVIGGFEDGEYKPSRPVTRAQMATFLNNAYAEITGVRLASSQDFFTDDNGNHHEKNINGIAGAGIAAGKTSTTYAPGESVKRDQMATFLARETDLLVEGGEVTKPNVKDADVVLTSHSVKQGGKVTGKIVSREGVEITGAKVEGCSLAEQALTLAGDENAFEITIPAGQPASPCTLTFTISQRDGEDIVDLESISVSPYGSLTDAPELQAVSVGKANTAGDVPVTFTFDEPLDASAGADAAAFRLYTPASEAILPVSEPVITSASVMLWFSKADYDVATTASVAHGAVLSADGDALPNPEGSKRLLTSTLALTASPDLLAMEKVEGSTYAFEFDESAYDTGDATNYHLVFTDGSKTSGERFAEAGNGSAIRLVQFPETDTNAKTVARGYVDADAVGDAPTKTTPSEPEDVTSPDPNKNPLQAVHKAADARPHLRSISIDAVNDRITYQFDRGIDVKDTKALPGNQNDLFTAYAANGKQVRSSSAVASRTTVTATFMTADGSDPIPTDTVGAGVMESAVSWKLDHELTNRADALRVGQKFDAGTTAAPDLLEVKRSAGSSTVTLTFRFDQPLAPTLESGQQFTLYQQDGTRRELVINPATSPPTCAPDGATVVCSAPTVSDIGRAIATAVLAGVEAQTVEHPDNELYRNYPTSLPTQD